MIRDEYIQEHLKPRYRILETYWTGQYDQTQHDIVLPGSYTDIAEVYNAWMGLVGTTGRRQYRVVVEFGE